MQKIHPVLCLFAPSGCWAKVTQVLKDPGSELIAQQGNKQFRREGAGKTGS